MQLRMWPWMEDPGLGWWVVLTDRASSNCWFANLVNTRRLSGWSILEMDLELCVDKHSNRSNKSIRKWARGWRRGWPIRLVDKNTQAHLLGCTRGAIRRFADQTNRGADHLIQSNHVKRTFLVPLNSGWFAKCRSCVCDSVSRGRSSQFLAVPVLNGR